MNKKVVQRIGFGVVIYAIFVIAVIKYYPDTPQNMDWEDRQEYNKVQIGKIEFGLTKKEILKLLGSPDITEAKRVNGTQWQVMFYRTQHVHADGITTPDECTPLLFENDALVAWGSDAYLSYQNKQ